jgi:hypothetical protein
VSGLFGGGSTPAAPKFVPVDVASTTALSTAADQSSYALSDADFAKRFPQLVAGRQASLNDSISQLGGSIGDQSTGALQAAGLAPEAASMSTGNEFQTSRNEGQNVLAKESRDRNYFENELSTEGQLRSFGPSGGNLIQEAVANSGNLNAANSANYLTGVNAYDASLAQSGQNLGGYASLLSSAIKQYNTQPTPAVSTYTDPFSDPYTPIGNVPAGG